MSPYLIDVRGESGPYGVWDYLAARPYPQETPETYTSWDAVRRRVDALNADWRRAHPQVRLLPLRLSARASAE